MEGGVGWGVFKPKSTVIIRFETKFVFTYPLEFEKKICHDLKSKHAALLTLKSHNLFSIESEKSDASYPFYIKSCWATSPLDLNFSTMIFMLKGYR